MICNLNQITTSDKSQQESFNSDQPTNHITNSSSSNSDKDISVGIEQLILSSKFSNQKAYEEFYTEKLLYWNYSLLKDEYRPAYAAKSGGIEYADKEVLSTMRSVGYDIIKQIGKKIISGDFNLTTIGFPIKVMLPKTILQSIASSLFQFPIYLSLTNSKIDPLERFKFVITSTIACFHASSVLLKPMNPILGETFELIYEDGTRVYMEQTSHHPPISHFYMLGANNNFKLTGYSHFTSGAGLNSLKVYNKGKREFSFPDGTKITSNFCHEIYNNTFFGTVRHESLGEMVFRDLKNGFECILKYDSVKKKPSDYFTGEIKSKKIVVSKVYGSYLSFIEFNNIRYWDIRENIPIKYCSVEKQLPSSSLLRQDRILLERGDLIEAQKAKEQLEELQRYDRKLREKAAKKK